MKSKWLFTMAIVCAMALSAGFVMAQDATQTPPPTDQAQTTPTTPPADASAPATTDQSSLPATASPIPLVGLGSLLAIGSGLVLSRFRRR